MSVITKLGIAAVGVFSLFVVTAAPASAARPMPYNVAFADTFPNGCTPKLQMGNYGSTAYVNADTRFPFNCPGGVDLKLVFHAYGTLFTHYGHVGNNAANGVTALGPDRPILCAAVTAGGVTHEWCIVF